MINTSKQPNKHISLLIQAVLTACVVLLLCSSVTAIAAAKCRVTFVDSLNNKTISTVYVAKGGTAKAPAAPKKEHYSFKKWDKPLKNIKSNVTIKALYEKKKYTVTFSDGVTGKTIAKKKVPYKENASFPSCKTHKGYVFKKWSSNGKSITKDTTIKAQYAQVFTVTFKANGKVLKQQTVEKGKNATAPKAPALDSKKFAGWNKSYKNVKKNITVTAAYNSWPDYASAKQVRMYNYGGVRSGDQSYGTKKVSMKIVESHGLRDTAIRTATGRSVFDQYYNYLKKGVDQGLDFQWVFEQIRHLPAKDRFDTESTIEWELYGFTCDPSKYKEVYTDEYGIAEYKKNLTCKKSIEALSRGMCSASMTEREAAATIFEYICKKLRYTYTMPARDNRAYLALKNGMGSCQGYSKLFKAMCNAVGIECDLVAGKAKGDNGWDGHMWNRVKLDNVWYYVDTSWCDLDMFFCDKYIYSKTLWPDHRICSIFE